jgi:ABC-type polysaccharide/polyol phosphate export permease
MPLFFGSDFIYATSIMPVWLKIVSHLNPLTYVVDALRNCMLAGSTSTFGLCTDYAVILFLHDHPGLHRRPTLSAFGNVKHSDEHF